MTAIDEILDGLEKELELERELGVRTVEVDRNLLIVADGDNGCNGMARPLGGPPGSSAPTVINHVHHDNVSSRSVEGVAAKDFVFLHDRPLTGAGIEMMAKIVTAMGRTAETAPVVIVPPVPAAKVVVVLGALALRKFFPGLKGEPGQWLTTPDGRSVLVTYSPAYILRFAATAPAVKKIKQDMWRSLKAVMQRVRQ